MKLVTLFLIFIFSMNLFAGEMFKNPRVNINGVEHKIIFAVVYPDGQLVQYRSADGFCVSKGFERATENGSRNEIKGPYAILDGLGNTREFMPNFNNKYAIYVYVGFTCE